MPREMGLMETSWAPPPQKDFRQVPDPLHYKKGPGNNDAKQYRKPDKIVSDALCVRVYPLISIGKFKKHLIVSLIHYRRNYRQFKGIWKS